MKALKRLTDGKPQRNAQGDITQAASYQSRDIPNARIEPHRKWFTNSRVISQSSLTAFRDAIAQQTSDPNSFLLKSNKLPMSLIRDDDTKRKNGVKIHKAKMVVEAASFSDTFGPKAQRKRVKIGLGSFADLAGETVKMHGTYLERLEEVKLLSGQMPLKDETGDLEDDPVDTGASAGPREPIFSKGQSKRIWNELYKVMDSSDVIAHVLDARDPLGTRCKAVEKYLKEEAPHKHLVFILNKVSPKTSMILLIILVRPSPNISSGTYRSLSIPSPLLVRNAFCLEQLREAVPLQLWEIETRFTQTSPFWCRIEFGVLRI